MSVAVEPWRHTLQTTRAYSQLCFEVNDFSYFDGRAALQEKAPLMYRTKFHKLVSGDNKIDGPYSSPAAYSGIAGFNSATQQKEEVEQLAKDTGENVKNKTKQFGDELLEEVKKKPNSPAELPEWQKKLKTKNEERKKEINDMMDKSMNDAMLKIEKLPEPMRAPAADAWTACWDWIMGAIKKVVEFLNKAWDAVVGVWNGIIKWVDGAIASVKEWASDAIGAVSGAISKIRDVFGSIF